MLRENNERIEAIKEVAGCVFSAHLSNPDNDDMVFYLDNFDAGGADYEDDNEINEMMKDGTSR